MIPTDGCHRHVRREPLLLEISGGRLTSSRTGWVPNPTEVTPDERLPRIEPGQDAQPDDLPTDTGVGTLSRDMPLGLLWCITRPTRAPTAWLMTDAWKGLSRRPVRQGPQVLTLATH